MEKKCGKIYKRAHSFDFQNCTHACILNVKKSDITMENWAKYINKQIITKVRRGIAYRPNLRSRLFNNLFI